MPDLLSFVSKTGVTPLGPATDVQAASSPFREKGSRSFCPVRLNQRAAHRKNNRHAAAANGTEVFCFFVCKKEVLAFRMPVAARVPINPLMYPIPRQMSRPSKRVTGRRDGGTSDR
jgi:hypothetical protein